jgi:TonB-linked SusC/RagA family outer membrane protein
MNFTILFWHGFFSRAGLQFFRIMKIIVVILVATILHVSAKTFAQNVSLHKKNVALSSVLSDISDQTGFDVFYSNKVIKKAKPVTIDLTNVPLKDALEICFAGQPLTFIIENKAVTVSEKAKQPASRLSNEQANLTISGMVVDENSNPATGASILVKDSKLATTTDIHGVFLLTNVPDGSTIIISYIGYKKIERKAQGNMGMIKLEQAVSDLDQVQVIAYGQTTQRYNIGSVSTVTAEQIKNQPVTNVLEALSGRVPGLNITTTNGAPGANTLTQIRGQNNLSSTAGNNGVVYNYDQPLYVVDGVPVPLQNSPMNVTSIAAAGSPVYWGGKIGLSTFNGLNPNDIESISVLKDADATSIYGSQGSNGVILITTKRGRAGKDAVSVSVNTGPTTASRTTPMMNTQQYLAMRKEALANGGFTATDQNAPDLTIFDQNRYTNWMKYFYGGTGEHTDSHVSLSGGSANTNYIVSGGYTRETYDFPGGSAENRFSLHSDLSHSSNNNRFKMDFGFDYSYDRNNSTGDASILAAFTLPPNFPDLLDDKGNLVWSYKGYGFESPAANPLGYLKEKAVVGLYTLNSHLSISYQILPLLKFSVNAGYGRNETNVYNSTPIASQNPADGILGSATWSNGYADLFNIEPQFNFDKQIGKGKLRAVIGGTYRKNVQANLSVTGQGYTSDALLSNSTAGTEPPFVSNTGGEYKYVALFARANYIWDDKYILNATANRNGSSNFGPQKQFGNFGSAGAGWIISEEKFIKGSLPWLSFAKISANYGTTGSDGVAPYQYQANWTQANTYSGYQGIYGYVPANPLNPVYAWSMDKKFDEQIDLGFLKDRIYLNLTFYQNRSENQLVQYQQAIQTGFSSITENAPYSVGNYGTEVNLTSRNIVSKSFTWTTNFNISRNRNKLLKFPGLEASPYANTYVLGKSITSVQVAPFAGVDPQTGVFQYITANGQKSFHILPTSGFNNNGGDLTQLIDLAPKFMGGFNNTFTYKGFSLTLFFQFAKQTGVNYLYSVYSAKMPGAAFVNLPAALLNRWQKPGDQSDIERLTTGKRGNTLDSQAGSAATSFNNSSGAYSDASYIRLKNVSFSYALPDKLLNKWSLTGCTVFVNAQNLFLITGYKAGDPETMSLYSIPPQRTIVAGINLSL